MRTKTAPAQLGMLSLSPKVDPEGDDCAYTVGPLARFGVVQSLPLASRMAALKLAMEPVATVKDKAEAELAAADLLVARPVRLWA